ncbi:O-methyltransferase [Rhodococcoides kroppenstedtii]|uniref:O-methyltransferase n=1 Tax=Rhodococcoides kroppenstedtii TaxID=293050 RepID=UPI00363E56B1
MTTPGRISATETRLAGTFDERSAGDKLASVMARTVGAKRVLIVDPVDGESTAHAVRAVGPRGRVVTLVATEAAADTVRSSLDEELAARVDLMVGEPLTTLARIRADDDSLFGVIDLHLRRIARDGPVDAGAQYVEWALVLGRPGTVLIADGVVGDGAVDTDGPAGDTLRAMLNLVAAHPRLDGTAVQTVGVHGRDGLLLAVITD